MFAWAMENGLAEMNPTVGTAKPKAPPSRSRVLSDQELLAIWKATEEGTDFNRIVRLLILTGQRRSEVGGMCWPEFNTERTAWTIPGPRAKNGREHSLPLPPLAIEIINSVPQIIGQDCLFGRTNRGFTTWALCKKALDARLGDQVRPWVLHDSRRTVATRLGDLGAEPHIIEALLNHQSGHKRGVAGVYNKSKYERAVKNAVAMWNNHIAGLIEGRDDQGKVVTFPQMTV
jgi:integrase